MKSNIFNMLGWFSKKKCESEAVEIPKCNCKSLEDTRVEYAVKISESDALERLLNGRKIEFEKEYACYHDGLFTHEGLRYRFKVKAVEIFVNTTDDCDFYKLACLACNTCLGWSHVSDPLYRSGVTPSEHFNVIIENKIISKKRDIELSAALEKERIEKKKKAKEICGEI